MSGYYNERSSGGTVAIQDEGISLTPNVSVINFTGAGVTGTVLGSVVTENIPGIAGMQNETPTGAIDNNNVTFTVVHTPAFVQLNGAIQTASGVDYTLTGLTITFVNAPQTGSILRSYY